MPPAPEPTRAQLDQIPFATIAVSIDGGPRGFVIPLADNGGYLDYADQTRRGIVMYGGLVTGTHGYGYNLSAVRHAIDDPVAEPVPLADWPTVVDRSYQFPRRDQKGYAITLRCHYQPVAREEVVIAEIIFDLTRVEETCANNTRTVTNTYWVEPETGFIWKSEQWIGPNQPQLTIEIVRPYRKGA